MTRDNILLMVSIIIVIGIGIYTPLVEGEPERLILTLPLLSILLIASLMLYFIATAETRFYDSLNRRLPPIEHLEKKDEVEYESVQLVKSAEHFIVATGGKSRNLEYLNTISKKVKSGHVNYWRILFGYEITHEMCEHLIVLLNVPGVSIGRTDDQSYDHMLVTDSGYINPLPIPGHGDLMGVKISNKAIAERLFHYFMRVYKNTKAITKEDEIRLLCECCRKRK